MSKAKVSAEEKRKRLADIFYETKDFFQLKELEKIAPKTKGIVERTVKEVLESLVVDNIVTCEKIGVSNYYWSFPSTAYQTRKRKIDELESDIRKLREKKTEVDATIQREKASREGSDNREALLEELKNAQATNRELVDELRKYQDNDPALLVAKTKAANIAKEAANRWTENIFAVQSYVSNNFNISTSDFNKQFNIPEDFDTIP
ncbi:meiotic nuclear division protein 1 [Cladochytrium replicatum]|nr:meiotic nuclear division protein 1 [Cladochytrium replicatum]